MNPVHTFPPYFPKIRSKIFFCVRLGLPSSLFRSGYPTKISYALLICPIRAACPDHLILLDLNTLVILFSIRSLFQIYEAYIFPSSPMIGAYSNSVHEDILVH